MAEVEHKTITLNTGSAAAEVHLLPCSIERDGPAPVSSYFKPQALEACTEGEQLWEAAFRGRRLNGATVALPDGATGHVLSLEPRSRDADVLPPPAWRCCARFDTLTYWSHSDEKATKTDPQRRAMDWVAVSQAMHAPVSPEQVDAELAAQQEQQQQQPGAEGGPAQ